MDRSRLRMDQSEYWILPAQCHQRRKINFAGPKPRTSKRTRPNFFSRVGFLKSASRPPQKWVGFCTRFLGGLLPECSSDNTLSSLPTQVWCGCILNGQVGNGNEYGGNLVNHGSLICSNLNQIQNK